MDKPKPNVIWGIALPERGFARILAEVDGVHVQIGRMPEKKGDLGHLDADLNVHYDSAYEMSAGLEAAADAVYNMAEDWEIEVHEWVEAVIKDRNNLTFWVCLRCGRTSPGPTDNVDLQPSVDGPCARHVDVEDPPADQDAGPPVEG
ncbi:unnamed protein product [marine sediment metagenome]|uniref:Uncharacterized protein n=1 Tax=marine sediment metagenome TaxID=412755 RepID=X1AM40_9ZZZZ